MKKKILIILGFTNLLLIIFIFTTYHIRPIKNKAAYPLYDRSYVENCDVLLSEILSYVHQDNPVPKERLIIDSIEEWVNYSNQFLNDYHINLNEQINYYSNTTPYDMDLNKLSIIVEILPPNKSEYILHRNTITSYDGAFYTFEPGKKLACITREEDLNIVTHLSCNILAIDKTFTTPFSEESSFFNKDDQKRIKLKEINDYEVIYSGFMSILAEELVFPPLQSTFIIDSQEALNEFEEKCNVIDFTHSKYLCISTREDAVDLDYDKVNLIISVNTTIEGSRTYGYSVKKLFLVDNKVIPIFDYKNKETIVNAEVSPYPIKSKHVYLTLIKVDKYDIPWLREDSK